MPSFSRATLDAGLYRTYIDQFDNALQRYVPVEVAQERRDDFDLLNARVVDTYGHNGYIKCFELTFAERVVQIEVRIGEGRNWRDFDLSDPANAEFLAHMFMAVLKRPTELVAAQHAGRTWQARIAPEHRPVRENAMSYTYGDGTLDANFNVYATPVVEPAPYYTYSGGTVTWNNYPQTVPVVMTNGADAELGNWTWTLLPIVDVADGT